MKQQQQQQQQKTEVNVLLFLPASSPSCARPRGAALAQRRRLRASSPFCPRSQLPGGVGSPRRPSLCRSQEPGQKALYKQRQPHLCSCTQGFGSVFNALSLLLVSPRPEVCPDPPAVRLSEREPLKCHLVSTAGLCSGADGELVSLSRRGTRHHLQWQPLCSCIRSPFFLRGPWRLRRSRQKLPEFSEGWCRNLHLVALATTPVCCGLRLVLRSHCFPLLLPVPEG